jgi:hypothetical protein
MAAGEVTIRSMWSPGRRPLARYLHAHYPYFVVIGVADFCSLFVGAHAISLRGQGPSSVSIFWALNLKCLIFAKNLANTFAASPNHERTRH